MRRTNSFLLLAILLATPCGVGCDLQLGVPIETDPVATGASLAGEEAIEEPQHNPHLGLTAGRLVIPPPATPDADPAPGDVIQELLDELAPEDADLIRDLFEDVVPPAPVPDPPDEEDGALTWGALKRRYAPAL